MKSKSTKRTIHLFQKFKIRYTFLLPMILWIMVSSIVLSTIVFFVSGKFIENENTKFIHKIHEETGSQLELNFNRLSIFSSNLLKNNTFHKLLRDNSKTFDEKSESLSRIFGDIGYETSVIGFIKIITNDLIIYNHTLEDIQLPTPPIEILNQYLSEKFIWQWGEMVHDQNGKAYLPYILKVHNLSTMKDSGIAIIYLREDTLHASYNNLLPQGSESFILSGENYVISHSKSDYIGYKLFDNNLYMDTNSFSSNRVNQFGKSDVIVATNLDDYIGGYHLNWTIITKIPTYILFKELDQIRTSIIIITILTVTLVSLVILSLSKTLSTSISNFNQRIQQYIKGNVTETEKGSVSNEILELEHAYDALIQRIQYLIETNNQEKEKQRDLELQALQAQINPHFLYNTLDAVAWIAKMKNQKDIVDIILSLATFFRLSLHKGDKYITLEEELDIVKSYVAIEKIRFPNKFELITDIDEDLLDYTVLKLIFQPFVENAIKHGISKKKGPGTIHISGFLKEGTLIFQISDDGIGNDDISAFFKPAKVQSGGYGILNVRERMRIEYGKGTDLSITSAAGKGTLITITIPMID
ncbi:sensor histidine kinase [Vallitalea okinawensis]|uniref:sensor histidine kinase n=1 Tax=Vallitalea okinawensis TaxID=2078660 RepID=UPI000CFE0511|nr:sensor histidine kinase [Vallitalea okinawensis]